jgi:hypothetical protein
MLLPSDELLFQYGVPWPVVDEKVTGTPTKPAFGELMVSATAAAGINIAAARIPSVFIVSPDGLLRRLPANLFGNLLRLAGVFRPS